MECIDSQFGIGPFVVNDHICAEYEEPETIHITQVFSINNIGEFGSSDHRIRTDGSQDIRTEISLPTFIPGVTKGEKLVVIEHTKDMIREVTTDVSAEWQERSPTITNPNRYESKSQHLMNNVFKLG
jgi:hypothetical protein